MHAIETTPPRKLTRQAKRTADLNHRYFRLVVGKKGDGSAGIAYAGKTPVYHAEGQDPQDVAAHLRTIIDADLEQRGQQKPSDWTVGDFALALHLISGRINAVQSHILKRIGEASDNEVDLETIVWPSSFSPDAVQRAFSRLLKMIVHALSPQAGASNGASREAIAQISGNAESGPWVFIPALRQAAREFTEGNVQ